MEMESLRKIGSGDGNACSMAISEERILAGDHETRFCVVGARTKDGNRYITKLIDPLFNHPRDLVKYSRRELVARLLFTLGATNAAVPNPDLATVHYFLCTDWPYHPVLVIQDYVEGVRAPSDSCSSMLSARTRENFEDLRSENLVETECGRIVAIDPCLKEEVFSRQLFRSESPLLKDCRRDGCDCDFIGFSAGKPPYDYLFPQILTDWLLIEPRWIMEFREKFSRLCGDKGKRMSQ
jgi:hypothetical protein